MSNTKLLNGLNRQVSEQPNILIPDRQNYARYPDEQNDQRIERGIGEYPRSVSKDLTAYQNAMIKVALVMEQQALPATFDIIMGTKYKTTYATDMRQFSIYNGTSLVVYVSRYAYVDATHYEFIVNANKQFVSPELNFRELYFAIPAYTPTITAFPNVSAFAAAKYTPQTSAI